MNDVSVNKNGFELTTFSLRIIALVSMFIDHADKTVLNIDYIPLQIIGRLAFPIFAFQLVEGYFYTGNYKKYIMRMFIFAIISEIPFNLMVGGGLIYPFHQNVLWTMLIGLIVIKLIDLTFAKIKNKLADTLIVFVISILGFIVGNLLMVDYFGYGVLTFVVFYLAKRYKKYYYVIQFVGIFLINYWLNGIAYEFYVFGMTLILPLQLFAVFSLPLIWLYKGRQGYHSKWWAQFYYWFYPVHILVLYSIYWLSII